jgi:hypothetical protein
MVNLRIIAESATGKTQRHTVRIWGRVARFSLASHAFVTMDKTKKVNIMSRFRLIPKLAPLGLLAWAALAAAQQQQQPAQTTSPPSEKPPRLERIEPGSDVPATTIPPKGGTQIKERKENGVVTEVDVQAGPSHYTMRPAHPAGTGLPGTVETNSGASAPQWKILEFDLNKKRKEGEPTAAAPAQVPAAAEVPPPPRPEQK